MVWIHTLVEVKKAPTYPIERFWNSAISNRYMRMGIEMPMSWTGSLIVSAFNPNNAIRGAERRPVTGSLFSPKERYLIGIFSYSSRPVCTTEYVL